VRAREVRRPGVSGVDQVLVLGIGDDAIASAAFGSIKRRIRVPAQPLRTGPPSPGMHHVTIIPRMVPVTLREGSRLV
jgi:hypothetical protein